MTQPLRCSVAPQKFDYMVNTPENKDALLAWLEPMAGGTVPYPADGEAPQYGLTTDPNTGTLGLIRDWSFNPIEDGFYVVKTWQVGENTWVFDVLSPADFPDKYNTVA